MVKFLPRNMEMETANSSETRVRLTRRDGPVNMELFGKKYILIAIRSRIAATKVLTEASPKEPRKCFGFCMRILFIIFCRHSAPYQQMTVEMKIWRYRSNEKAVDFSCSILTKDVMKDDDCCISVEINKKRE